MLMELYNNYQKDNSEKFNLDFIFQRNKLEDFKSIMDDICKALEIMDGVTYLGSELITDESKFKDSSVSISDSRLMLLISKFKLNGIDAVENKPVEKIISLPIYFPKLIDNFYYILNGNKYFAIYQMIDKGTYVTNNFLSLKTLLMPIIFKNQEVEMETLDNKFKLKAKNITLDIFKYQANILYYFFAKFGFSETNKFFGVENIEVVDINEEVEVDESVEVTYFKINKKYKLAVDCNEFSVNNQYSYKENYITTLCDALNINKLNLEDLENKTYWLNNLGKVFGNKPTLYESKANKILISLERILDERTKKNLIHIRDYDKENIYCILRWIFIFFNELIQSDNMDIKNKRIRLTEYLIHPLLLKFSDASYRILNTNKLTIQRLEGIFSNIPNTFCISKLVTNKLLRYSNCVNTLDLYACALKCTQSGPQGLGGENGDGSEVPVKYRGQHPSYVGKVDLIASSNSDPGLTMTLSPFIKTDGYYFDTTVEYDTGLNF